MLQGPSPLRRVMTDIKERLQDSGGIEWPHGAFCPVCDKLKLDVPGMAEIFEQRGVDLETPNVSCECAKLLVKRAEWANLPAGFEERTFVNFVQREGTGEAYRAAASFADWKSPCMLTLVGGTGTGKTYLLQAIANALMERGTSVRYEYAPEPKRRDHPRSLQASAGPAPGRPRGREDQRLGDGPDGRRH